MYCNPRYPYQWHPSMYDYWNNREWGCNWKCQYDNGFNTNQYPYNWNIVLNDYGQFPLVMNIDQATKQNTTYRTALWTGRHFQVTLMSINVGDDIGLEVHPKTDQFIRIEQGQGLVQMGESKEKLNFQEMACDGFAVMIPAGKWHNITNTGNIPLKVYVIYAPPEHPYGTVHITKAAAKPAQYN